MQEDLCMILNLERNMFWKQSKYGYTHEIKEAGLFPRSEAVAIVNESNRGKKKNEIKEVS